MFKKLVEFYESKKARERVLLLLTVWIALLVVASWMLRKNSEMNSQLETLSIKQIAIDGLLSQKQNILDELQSLQQSMDKSKILNVEDLQIAVEECAKSVNLLYDMSQPVETKISNFRIYTLALSFQNAPLESLIALEESITDYAPYISIKNATLTKGGRNSLNAKYQISAFMMD